MSTYAYAYFQKRDVMHCVAEIEIPAELADNVRNAALKYVFKALRSVHGGWSFGPNFEGTLDDREGQVNLDYCPNVKFVGEHTAFQIYDDVGFKTDDFYIAGERSIMAGDLIILGSKTYEVTLNEVNKLVWLTFKEYVGDINQ